MRKLISFILLLQLFVQTNYALIAWGWYWVDGARTAKTDCIYIKETLCNGKCYVQKIILNNEAQTNKAKQDNNKPVVNIEAVKEYIVVPLSAWNREIQSKVLVNIDKKTPLCIGYATVPSQPPETTYIHTVKNVYMCAQAV